MRIAGSPIGDGPNCDREGRRCAGRPAGTKTAAGGVGGDLHMAKLTMPAELRSFIRW